MQLQKLKNVLEAVLLSAEKPMDVAHFDRLFELDENRPSKDEIRHALNALEGDYDGRGMQLKQVSSGYRMQIPEDYAVWVARLWEEKPPRYSRALLETLVLIAYRQPITRGEIEAIRGVSVSSHIIKTLSERQWIRVLGHKDVPGKPAMYGSTREFLDYFNLKTLDELPPLSDIKDLDKIHPELGLDDAPEAEAHNEPEQAAAASAADVDSSASESSASEPEQQQVEAEIMDASADERADEAPESTVQLS
jgi:segregation and condensation protein B